MRAAIVGFVEQAAREIGASGLVPGVAGVAVNLLGDRTQLTVTLGGAMVPLLKSSGVFERLDVLPLETTICANVLAADDGYLDLSDEANPSHGLLGPVIRGSGGVIQAYLGVALELDGIRVGTVCVYGSKPWSGSADEGRREAVLRRHAALLGQQLAEVKRLRDENAGLKAELRGAGPSGGAAAVHATEEDAAAWRETSAILGDLERSLFRSEGPDGSAAACVIQLRPASGAVAVVAVSAGAVEHHGMRCSVLRQAGDDDLVAYWRQVLTGTEGADVDLATAPAPARLGTAPGAFTSMLACALPAPPAAEGALTGLIVLTTRVASSDGDRAVRAALVRHFASVVATAQRAAVGVYRAPAADVGAASEAPAGPDMLAAVRQAFGGMKLRGLLALAEERGVPGAEDAQSVDELLARIAEHAATAARQRRARLQSLSVRELLGIGAAAGITEVEAAESKGEMIEAILAAEGIFARTPAAPLDPLPLPPRRSVVAAGEQATVAFDAQARWLREALSREHESLPYSRPGAEARSGLPRAPVPHNESARIETLARLGLDDVGAWSEEELAVFDGIASAAAALAGTSKGMLSIVDGAEQTMLGISPRIAFPLLLGDSGGFPRQLSICQYVVAKGAPLAVADTASPEAGPIGVAIAKDAENKNDFGLLPRSYLGVPMVTADGVAIGNVCVMDDEPRPDFATNPRLIEQIESLAAAALNLLELRHLRDENARLSARRSLDVAGVEPLQRSRSNQAPTERVALLLTDIEGSTALHERDPALMKRALEVHDAVMRRAISDNGGIELGTEGDAFFVAFHTAADAIRCCFDAQLRLQAAPWPEGLERLGDAARTDESGQFRGCRVRMAVHFAEAGGGLLGARSFEVSRHGTTRRPQYRGRVVDVCRFLSEMPSGGQVLVTEQAFDEVALALPSALGAPQVIDLGRYEASMLGDLGHVYQVLPRALSARRFDPPLRIPAGGRLTAPGYVHAPRTSPLVIAFVLPVGLPELRLRSDAVHARGLDAFCTSVREELVAHGGYEMKESDGAFMCAFAQGREAAALAFGAAVHARLAQATGKVLRCRVGLHGGDVTIEPHPSTGRMDAFGPTCNRAARLAKAAHPGQTVADAATARAAIGFAGAIYDLGEHEFKGVEDSIRVVQVGEGFFPPIKSLAYASELLAFDASPENHVSRARAALQIFDALGVESFPTNGGRSLDRPRLQAAITEGLEAREARRSSTRFVPDG